MKDPNVSLLNSARFEIGEQFTNLARENELGWPGHWLGAADRFIQENKSQLKSQLEKLPETQPEAVEYTVARFFDRLEDHVKQIAGPDKACFVHQGSGSHAFKILQNYHGTRHARPAGYDAQRVERARTIKQILSM